MKRMKCRIGDLTSIKTGKLDANASSENGKYPFFTCSKEPLKIDTYSYDCECVLVAGNGDLNVKYYNGKFDAYQRTYIIENNSSGRLYMPFLFWFMQGYVEELRKQAIGGVIKYIKLGNLTDAIIELPSFGMQKKIVSHLEKVAHIYDDRKKQLNMLDNLIKSRFVELFGDPYINDKNWTVDTLGNYMTTLTDFSANGSYELLDSNVVMYDEPNYAVMVRTTDLESGDLSSDVKYIDKSAYELLNKSKLFGGELIMNKIGSAGKIYIMPYINQPASLGRNAFMFRFDDRLNMKYLYFLLSSDYGTNEIQQYVRGAVTKTITKDSTRAIKIIVPPSELQNTFAAFVELTDKLKFEVRKSLEETQLLMDSLMQKYFG